MRNEKIQKNYKGFSLFELIVTMGILLILSTIVFPVAIQKAQQSKLQSYASQLVTDIYFQQQESYLKGVPRGITLQSNGYILFDGDSLSTATEQDYKKYPQNISLHSISFSLGNEILFLPGEFKPSSFGKLTMSDGFDAVQVYINQEGLIGYENF